MVLVHCSSCSSVIHGISVGFGKPQGYKGRGKEGKGQGKDFETLTKPLPFVKGQGFSKKLLLYHQSARFMLKQRKGNPVNE